MQNSYLSWKNAIEMSLHETMQFDVAHDLSHIKRVTSTSLYLAQLERADPNIVYPASMLHDCVNVDKKSPLRSQGSLLSADHAVILLQKIGYPNALLDPIHHAICAHSFSAHIEPKTIEAMVLQDADRLDALGAIGLSRCLMLGGKWDSLLYHVADPFAKERDLNDKQYCLDHLYKKLKKLPETMKTLSGQAEAKKRWLFIESYLKQLKQEIKVDNFDYELETPL